MAVFSQAHTLLVFIFRQPKIDGLLSNSMSRNNSGIFLIRLQISTINSSLGMHNALRSFIS